MMLRLVKRSGTGPPDDPSDALVQRARPMAIKLARTYARLYRAQPAALDDCEQVACLALLEARPGYNKAQGPFEVYAWKRVAGAVKRFLHRELTIGTSSALDEAAAHHDTSDPFDDEDDDAEAELKGLCRSFTFRRVLGDARTAHEGEPERALAWSRVLRALSAALGALDETERRLLTLHYWEERPWQQVADALGISERHARRMDAALRARLFCDLKRRGVEEAL